MTARGKGVVGLSVLALTALALGALFCPWFKRDGAEVSPPKPAEVVTVNGAEVHFGYEPHPEETRRFVESLPKPFLAQAGPELLQAREKKPVFLYRALYEAYAAHNGGKQWKVGAQGIGDCFVAGTLVTMEDGTHKTIESVRPGDRVPTGAGWNRAVKSVLKKKYDGELVTIKAKGLPPIFCTPDHKFRCKSVIGEFWLEAEKIDVGFKVLGLTPGDIYDDLEVEQIERTAFKGNVYCLCVEKDHSFIANGYVVHNCVSWGWAHGADIHLAVMWKLGDSAEWKQAATEAIYGGSRVEARGVTRGGWSDGSYGAAAAKWVRDWGIVFRQPYDTVDLTTYSASRAKDWGNYGCGGRDDNGYLDKIASSHPIKNVVVVRNFEEAAAAIASGYPVPVCSSQGFSSTRDKDGFAAPRERWAHAMCFIGVRYEPRPGLLVLNSWGPDWISGPKWPEDQPDGSFWVDAEVATRMLRGGDSFAVSGYEGFPYRDLNHGDWVETDTKRLRSPLLRERADETLYALAP